MSIGRRGAVFAAVSIVALLGAAAAQAETLAEAIALAYQTNPNLQAQRAQLRALDENYVQARSQYRPAASLGGSASYTRRSRGTFGDFDSDSLGATLNLSQPIYSGGRVNADIRATQADILAAREQLRGVEAQVLLNVVQFYSDVRRSVAALAIRENNVAVLRRQLEETQARFEVGEITRTDVAQAEARLAAAEALYASNQAQLAVDRANYTSVVGSAPTELAPEPPLPGLPSTISAAFDIAESDNPNLRAADFSAQAAEARVALARSAYRPTVSATASLGATGPFGIDADRYVSSATIGANASIPLFTGGLNDSRVRQALEQENVARITIETRRREVNQQVSSSWNQLLSARAGLLANEEQVRAARVAFQGVQEEQRVGLRTTLDVLNAEQELRNAELSLVQARRDAYVAGATTLAAMGRLEAEDLVTGVSAYDPTANFERVRREGAVPWEGVIQRIDAIGAPQTSTPRRPAVPPATPPETAPIATAGALWRVDPASTGPIPQRPNIPAAPPFVSTLDGGAPAQSATTTPVINPSAPREYARPPAGAAAAPTPGAPVVSSAPVPNPPRR